MTRFKKLILIFIVSCFIIGLITRNYPEVTSNIYRVISGVPISTTTTTETTTTTIPASFASKVILIVWDGTQRNHLNDLLADGKLPNLKKLINEGGRRYINIFTDDCSCANDGDNYHTETGPGHVAILTGYGFPQTKNHANREDREKNESDCPEYCPSGSSSECFKELGPNPIPSGYTIFERLKGFDANIKTGLITGKNLSFFPFPAFKNAAPSSCCGTENDCGSGNAIDVCQPSNDPQENITSKALQFLNNYANSPFFLFVHFRSPDTEGHILGENSNGYTNAIIKDDEQTGRIVERLKDLGIYDKTVILITTDHGFVEGGKEHHPCVSETKQLWIVSSRKNVIDGKGVIPKQTSIVPTIFDIFGISKNVNPPFAGESLFVPITTTTTTVPTTSTTTIRTTTTTVPTTTTTSCLPRGSSCSYNWQCCSGYCGTFYIWKVCW